MKQTLISRLVMGALIGAAASASFAGQIQSSSVSIAREVITSNDQAVTSPAVAYRFFGDVDARNQSQTFQVQFVLPAGVEWKSAGVAASIRITDSVTGVVASQTAGDASPTVATYTVNTLALSADKSTLFATITVPQPAVGANQGLIKQPLIGISTSAVASQNPTAVKLKTIVGDVVECDTSVKTLPVEFKHFVALSSPAALATVGNAQADEHVRTGSTNTTTLITFPTNIKVDVVRPANNAAIDGGVGQSLVFKQQGALATAPAFDSWISNRLVNLGQVKHTQNAFGYDADAKVQYLLATLNQRAAANAPFTTIANSGQVEAKNLEVTVTASQGFVKNAALSSLFLSATANCAAPINAGAAVTITDTNKNGPIKLTLTGAELTAANANPYVCFDAGAGNATVIPSSAFDATAVLVKADNNAAFDGEQNNSCKGPMHALAGGVKIDVRNYASNARADGWLSVIRLINPSETRTIDVYGQYILANGLYGKSGKLATLAPRAVLNMVPAQVDAKLVNAPAHATAANNSTAAIDTNGDAPRLRITSDNGNTLRVQNYLYNPASKNFIEASGSQGVDFTGNTDRAPTGEGQYTEQDAQVGLNGN